MEPNWTDILTAFATVAAVVAAGGAWFVSDETLRTSYRPVLRPVPLSSPGVGLRGDTFKVKNIGTGPAVAVMLFDGADPDQVIGEIDVVEPLQPPPDSGEKDRVGSVQIWVRHPVVLDDDHAYRLLYQDIRGAWHETRFGIEGRHFRIRFLGPKRFWQRNHPVPKVARTRGQVATSADA